MRTARRLLSDERDGKIRLGGDVWPAYKRVGEPVLHLSNIYSRLETATERQTERAFEPQRRKDLEAFAAKSLIYWSYERIRTFVPCTPSVNPSQGSATANCGRSNDARRPGSKPWFVAQSVGASELHTMAKATCKVTCKATSQANQSALCVSNCCLVMFARLADATTGLGEP